MFPLMAILLAFFMFGSDVIFIFLFVALLLSFLEY